MTSAHPNIMQQNKDANSVEFKLIRKERTDKGIRVSGLPTGCNLVVLTDYIKTFGDIVETLEPQEPKRDFALYRFREKESADKIKLTPNHELPFGKITITGWFKVRKGEAVIKHTNGCLPESFNTNFPFDQQLFSLLDKLTPGREIMQMYDYLCSDVHAAVVNVFRNGTYNVFGSTLTGLAFKDSDVDLYIEPRSPNKNIKPERALKFIKDQIFRRSQHVFLNPVYINAKTPIIRFVHRATGLKCDLSCKNALGVRNSQLIKYFVDLDRRIKPFLLLIKYWAKYFDLTGSHQLISNYALVLMALFYLQQLDSPLIPTVAHLQSMSNEKHFIDNWQGNFYALHWIPNRATYNLTLHDLTRRFFDYYSNFDFANYVICPLLGRPVAKSDFLDPTLLPSEMAAFTANSNKDDVAKFGNGLSLCVQDPFVLNHNVARALGQQFVLERLMPNFTHASQAFCQTTNQAQLLTALFSEKNRVVAATDIEIDRVLLLKLLPKSIVGMTTELVGEQINSWLQDSYKFVVYALKELCSLDVQVIGSDDEESGKVRASKMRKLDDTVELSVPKLDKPVTLQCFGCYDIMDMRAVVRRAMPDQPMIPLKREKLITEVVLSKLKLDQTPPTAIKFTCRFVPAKEPPLISLEIKNLDSNQKKFRKWSIFLSDHLHKWFHTHFFDFRRNVMNPSPSTSNAKEIVLLPVGT